MKKLLKSFAIVAVLILGASVLASCHKDEDKTIAYDMLPAQAQTFVAKYFPGIQVLTVTKEHSTELGQYEVKLKNGVELEFDGAGEWVVVDAPAAMIIPTGIAPAKIQDYVTTSYPGYGINEISRSQFGYETELTNGIELVFTLSGDFVGIAK